MLHYWLLFSVFALGALGWNTQSRQTRLTPGILMAAAALALLIGFRWEVGADWFPYERMYEEISIWGIEAALEITEPLYGLLNLVAAKLGLDIWFVNIVCSILFVWGLVRFAQLQPNPWLAIVVAIPFLAIVVAMGYTRQGAAIGLAMLGIVAARDKSIKKSIIIILLAGTFHRSALILIPLVAISNTQNRFQTVLLAFIASILGYVFLLDSAVERYSSTYVEQVYQAEGAATRLAMNIVPSIIMLLWHRKLGLDESETRLWKCFAFLGLTLNFLLIFIDSTVALDRIGIYVIPIQILVFSRLPTLIASSNIGISFATLGVIVYSAAIQFTWLNFASNAKYWLPYQSLFTFTN